MNLNDVLVGRSIGSIVGPDIEIVPIEILTLTTTAYAVGDVLNPSTAPLVLSSAARFPNGAARLVQVDIWENAQTGTAIKPDLRLHVYDAEYVMPAQNAAYKHPSTLKSHLGYIDIVAADYYEYEASAAPPRFAHALKTIDPGKNFLTNSTRALFLGVEIRSASTFAADAKIYGALSFER